MAKFVLSVPQLKPRNPLALQARKRKGGAHRAALSTNRQTEQRELREEMTQLHRPSARERW